MEFDVSHEGENNLRVFENRNLLSVSGFKERKYQEAEKL